MPSLYSIVNLRSKFNDIFNLSKNIQGYYLNVSEKINYILENIINDYPNDYTFNLKVKGDGIKIGPNLMLLNFDFSIINQSHKAKTSKGHYTLGMFMIDQENYETYHNCLKNSFEQLENLNEVIINGRKIKISYNNGGDLKYLAAIRGVMSAYPCIYCEEHKKNFGYWSDSNKMSMYGSNARENNRLEILKIKKNTDQKKVIKTVLYQMLKQINISLIYYI